MGIFDICPLIRYWCLDDDFSCKENSIYHGRQFLRISGGILSCVTPCVLLAIHNLASATHSQMLLYPEMSGVSNDKVTILQNYHLTSLESFVSLDMKNSKLKSVALDGVR